MAVGDCLFYDIDSRYCNFHRRLSRPSVERSILSADVCLARLFWPIARNAAKARRRIDEPGGILAVHEAARKATWAYLATSIGDQSKVRVVRPAFEGELLWVATWRGPHKARQIAKNPKVELFYHLGPELVHLTVTGTARFIDDIAQKKRVWNGRVFDYDLAQFWPVGPEAPEFGLLLVTPTRVELTTLGDMTQGACARNLASAGILSLYALPESATALATRTI